VEQLLAGEAGLIMARRLAKEQPLYSLARGHELVLIDAARDLLALQPELDAPIAGKSAENQI
jgi:hypothetical protein